ncbi:hypothetical protein P7C73_g757, partial [Tremellales sp. Uapishka_1]
MSSPARLSLRAPPHLPFIQGWPGIPASPNRKPPGVHGTVELRIGAVPIKARWVRIEIRKHETVPGIAGSGSWEHVGEIVDLWKVKPGQEWDMLDTADFKFFLPLPDALPPSVEVGKSGGGIHYELVAALCYRQKGGLLKKESAPIMKVSEPLKIIKHELHSAWPLYNLPETRATSSNNGEVSLSVSRPSTAFGPTDRILLTATLKSTRRKPFKLKGFDTNLVEIVTVYPQLPVQSAAKSKKQKAAAPPIVKSKIIATSRSAVDESVGMGGEKSARIEMVVPPERLLTTVKNARLMMLEYELEVKAVCDGVPEGGRVAGMKCIVGPFSRAHAQQAVRDIGYFQALCPSQSEPSASSGSRPSSSTSLNYLTPSPHPPPTAFPIAKPAPVEGFIPRQNWRRPSSTGSTNTTTTTNTTYLTPLQTDYSPMPNHLRNQSLSGAGSFARTIDTTMSTPPPQTSQSDVGHGQVDDRDRNQRFSTVTNATFGKWDQGLRSPVEEEGTFISETSPITPTTTLHTAQRLYPNQQSFIIPPVDKSRPPLQNRTSLPPPSWQSAEQEKTKLYDQARSRAAAIQHASGASLDRIGMLDDIPTSAPPEYAPPQPERPAEYTAPEVFPNGGATSSRSGITTPPPVGYFETSKSSPLRNISQPSSPLVPEEQRSRPRSISPSKLASGSGSGSRGPKGPLLAAGAIDEKEQMRRFFEAQQRVARANGGGGSGSSASGSGSTVPRPVSPPPLPQNALAKPPFSPTPSYSKAPIPQTPKAFLSAADEKEAMKRRYEEATSKVARRSISVSGPASALESGSGSMPTAASSPPPAPYDSAAADQELMGKRYEKATSEVARRSVSASGSAAAPASPPAPYISAAEEKELMKRRYEEAISRVARTGTPPAQSSATLPPSAPALPPSTPALPKAYLSAADEKEAMRRRYEEATSRVGRRSVSGSEILSSPPASTSPGSGFPSAVAEKDLMRARYEDATRRSGSASPAPASSAHPSAADEKDLMKKRYEDATRRSGSSMPLREGTDNDDSASKETMTHREPVYLSPPTSPLIRDPTVREGKAKARNSMLAAGGAPPPLAPRPPSEYIHLLRIDESGHIGSASRVNGNGSGTEDRNGVSGPG